LIHIRELSFRIAVVLFVLPLGLVTAILQSITMAFNDVIQAEVGALNWLFGKNTEAEVGPFDGGGMFGGDDDVV